VLGNGGFDSIGETKLELSHNSIKAAKDNAVVEMIMSPALACGLLAVATIKDGVVAAFDAVAAHVVEAQVFDKKQLEVAAVRIAVAFETKATAVAHNSSAVEVVACDDFVLLAQDLTAFGSEHLGDELLLEQRLSASGGEIVAGVHGAKLGVTGGGGKDILGEWGLGIGVCCLLFGVCCLGFVVCCLLFGVCCLLFGVCCSLFFVLCWGIEGWQKRFSVFDG